MKTNQLRKLTASLRHAKRGAKEARKLRLFKLWSYYMRQCRVIKEALRDEAIRVHKLLWLGGYTSVKPSSVKTFYIDVHGRRVQ